MIEDRGLKIEERGLKMEDCAVFHLLSSILNSQSAISPKAVSR